MRRAAPWISATQQKLDNLNDGIQGVNRPNLRCLAPPLVEVPNNVRYRAQRATTARGRTETDPLPVSGHFGVRPLPSAATGRCRTLSRRSVYRKAAIRRGRSGHHQRNSRAGGFDHLGCTFGRRYSPAIGWARLGMRPSKRSIPRMVKKIRAMTATSRTCYRATSRLLPVITCSTRT